MDLAMLGPGEYVTLPDDPIRFYRTPLLGRLYRSRVARCVDMLPRGQRVLEVGYGSGVAFLNLAERFSEIHGVDLHDRGAEVAASFARHGLRPVLRQANVCRLPYPDNHFDAALAISIHEHLQPQEQKAALREVHRVLKPGGVYVIGVPGRNPLLGLAFRCLGYDMQEIHPSSERQVMQAASEVFEIDATRAVRVLGMDALTVYLSIRGRKAE
jgi:ubiquinone/menaquinone biosynthesis C-methylase UbiE